MATIRKEIVVEAPAPYVWAALREAGAAEHALGFAVDACLEGHAWDGTRCFPAVPPCGRS